MALVNCPECGKEISDKAEHCINCGMPIKPSIDDKKSDIEQAAAPVVIGKKTNKEITAAAIFIGLIVLSLILVPLINYNATRTEITDKGKSYILEAIDIADGFLDGNISASSASGQIRSLAEKIDSLDNPDADMPGYVNVNISLLGFEIADSKYKNSDKEKYNKVLKYRNDLAKEIREKTRKKTW